MEATSKRFYVVWLLFREALTRLLAARLLFLSGNLSRAVACTRDALEAAMTADVCSGNNKMCSKWLKGGQIKLTDRLSYDRALSWKSWQIVQSITNPLGTHSYLLATYLSSSVDRALLYPKNDLIQRTYIHDVKFVLWRMLGRSYQFLLYIKRNYPEVTQLVKNYSSILNLVITYLMENELQITLDEKLIELESVPADIFSPD